ncbi:MAG: type I-U CRISPR-associated helicase/endonuclease Cas3 [Polyangiaceae bacterium]|nr:type I-U CRISPR-associated helicase/endonuclease Cas3 [Polyangiaceae bacterium]
MESDDGSGRADREGHEGVFMGGAPQALEFMPNHGDHDLGLQWLMGALGLEEGQTPFPWQLELFRRFRQGEAVSTLDIPTGLGKTATIVVWLVARALGAPLPRRLVYVVDRRAVVDQATEVAEKLRNWVQEERSVSDALGLGNRPLPISTLRGQHVDNREWLEDPSAPAIVVGTVDMVGSRLLFSGYGVSSKMRPYHAGLLGTDTLIVLDEAHLVPAFEDLLRQIEGGIEVFGPKDPALCNLLPKFRLLSLSATGREAGSTPLTLTEADRANSVVSKRLSAKKTLTTVRLVRDASDAASEGGEDESDEAKADKKGKGPRLASVLAKQAWDLTTQGTDRIRCLVFCDKREDAEDVATELRSLAKKDGAEPTIELFVGGRRVRERVQARDALAQLGFLAGSNVSLERSAFLLATSAGEVGVDLDADHMVCDLVAWERMVQRLGRVNRRGDGDAKVVVVVKDEPAASDGTKKAIEKRDAWKAARLEIEKLTKNLSALQGEKTSIRKGRKRTSDEKAADEKRKQAEKELKKSISAFQKHIKAFKDADAKIVAEYEAEVVKHRALRRLLETVGEGGSLSPDALLQLRQRQADAVRKATTVEPLRPELTRALVDAWSMTSLEEHPGRPEIDPWLRGFHPNDPRTTVVWRQHLPVRNECLFNARDAKAAKRFFKAAPPHTSEQLETETQFVRDWLIKRAEAVYKTQDDEARLPPRKQVVTIALTPRGEVKGWRTLEQLAAAKGRGKKGEESKEAKKAREQLDDLLTGATLIVDARLGGLTNGLLDDKAQATAEAADDTTTTWLVRPDANDVPITGFRVHPLDASEQDVASWRTTPGGGWVRRYLFVTKVADGEPLAALAIDGWVGDAAMEDERAEADRPQTLDEHQSWEEECARAIAKRIGLDAYYQDIVALAASFHDEGKRSVLWQRAFKAPMDGRPYAKTKGPIDFDILDGYRHELGSLPYVAKSEGFIALPQEDQDLVLHLIAAHHGYARPVIGTSGCDDAPPSVVDERAREVALRFARLSRRWGPWGLAWLEALLRAADQITSRRNQREQR